MQYTLNGNWELTSPRLETPIIGHVPGNLELDLFAAGLEPDPYYGENQKAYRKYAFWDWNYTRTFPTPEGMAGPCTLVFDAVDCFADIYLNGYKIASFDNAFIQHKVPVTLEENAENKLEVRLFSAEKVSRTFPEEYVTVWHMPEAAANLWVRKPGHSYGWDIAPKLNLGGIWRQVYLQKDDEPAVFDELWLRTASINGDGANLDVYYDFHTDVEYLEQLTLKLTGDCGDSHFETEQRIYSNWGHTGVHVNHAKLWGPVGYGKPNLYTVQAELRWQGKPIGHATTRFGIRTFELDRSEVNIAGTGWFRFTLNGKPFRALGSNWVPADALHSNDHNRVIEILKLFTDSHCNMLRVWGGGVYEDEEFFDYCDEHGILVWQDFMFSGFKYPQDQKFLDKVKLEAESAVKRLRRRTSLVLWSGDNECDQQYLNHKEDPRGNKINRQVLPEVLFRMDPTRPYLPSSPYLSEKVFDYAGLDNTWAMTLLMPERHLWGSRENFRQPFYTDCHAKFVSEMGWHGCPSLLSLKKYIAPEYLKLDTIDMVNPQMACHASCPWETSGLRGRNMLMVRQNEEYYLDPPQDLPNFILASQIHQAEAFKYVVEHYRLDASCGGILWWNIMDCWPQLSDAVVDYYFNRKLSYYYLKRTQQPFCIMCTDVEGHNSNIIGVNDSSEPQKGTFTVKDGITGETLLSGEIHVAPYSRQHLGRLRNMRARNALWLMTWNTEQGAGANHFIAGNRVMSYAWYKSILPRIAEIDGTFSLQGTEITLE